jgi:hypothetical protein
MAIWLGKTSWRFSCAQCWPFRGDMINRETVLLLVLQYELFAECRFELFHGS